MNNLEYYSINNLDNIIRKSGLKKQEVADLKGVTPVTLSRHISGAINITLADAEDYGRILGVHSFDILYPTKPLNIIGKSSLTAEGKVLREYRKEPFGRVYMRAYMTDNIGAVYWTIDPEYVGFFMHWNNGLQLIEKTAFDEQRVDERCFQHFCLCELEEEIEQKLPAVRPGEVIKVRTKYLGGILYPQPGNRFTLLHLSGNAVTPINMEQNEIKDLKIKWACPLVGTIYRPELRDIEIIWNKDA